jgi:hypothetical protein
MIPPIFVFRSAGNRGVTRFGAATIVSPCGDDVWFHLGEQTGHLLLQIGRNIELLRRHAEIGNRGIPIVFGDVQASV